MKRLPTWFTIAALVFAVSTTATLAQQSQQQSPSQSQQPPPSLDIKSADGTVLKATFFPAAKPGPGVLLFHQSNRARASWDAVARQLAAAGINALTIDDRGYGESAGKKEAREQCHDADLDSAFEFLVSQPGVQRDAIGTAGAGWLGVDDSVETARRHSAELKSLVLISGETLLPQLRFLRQASSLPGLFIVSDDDEYPPTVEAMEWLYDTSSSPQKKLIHYASPKAPWLWYETSNASKVPATGSHGTDLFQRHPELPATIVDWFVTTLIKTPGRTAADTVASSATLNQIEMPGGVAQVAQQFTEARRKDPDAQLWPEVNLDIIGEDHIREADAEKKSAHPREAVANAEINLGIDIFKLNVLAYPDSADAYSNLADAYFQAGEHALALQYAQKALAMIDSHAAPLSSWSDTDQRRAEVRSGVVDLLKKLDAPLVATSTLETVPNLRDCAECPEMLIIPAGKFIMGSSAEEKAWAASKVGSADGVADEAPQHEVFVSSFALGKYDVTRAEFAAFVRDTGHSAGDGCGIDGFKWKKLAEKTWQNPGYKQTDRDPVVCVSWQDARAYIAWLNTKLRQSQNKNSSPSTDGPYRLPSESEWEYAARAGSTTRFSWGDDDTVASDHAWYKSNSNNRTHPVGQKLPNSFGLYDMVGNVWQWTEDCYDNTYATAPVDGRPNETPSTDSHARDDQGQCLRVDRGSWFAFPPWALRPATRERNPAGYRDTVMGFRVAKDLP
jgi:formylglycine-generating enzyme required for sulfatase activity/dienelactone hydrolase